MKLERRQMELKHQENDQVQRQQKIEENRILHNLKKWLKTEQALLEQFDFEEIELPVKIFRKRLKELQKLIEQSEEHASSYGYDLDEQTLSPPFINFSISCSNYSMNLKKNGTKTKIPVKSQQFPTNGRKKYRIPSKFWNIPSFLVEVTVGLR